MKPASVWLALAAALSCSTGACSTGPASSSARPCARTTPPPPAPNCYGSAGGINAPAARERASGAGIVVAVIDTGYRPHADLAGQILPGYDFISTASVANDGNGRDADASDPGDAVRAGECGGQPAQDQDASWHGTHVAGTIAALTNNGGGVAGAAHGAKILPVRVPGKCGGYTSDIADGIIRASGGTVSGVPANAHRARVLNLSLGGACGSTTQNAIDSARSRGTVVVVAAGNANVDAGGTTPANCQGVVAVAATNRAGGKASYSNIGSVVDPAAPGGDSGGYILSTINTGTTAPAGDGYAYYAGTSMATPHVAGTAALMLSKNGALTADEVEARLKGLRRRHRQRCRGGGSRPGRKRTGDERGRAERHAGGVERRHRQWRDRDRHARRGHGQRRVHGAGAGRRHPHGHADSREQRQRLRPVRL
jgi:serine protease